jgi:BASS family bile acid:Na+ symporter
MSLRELVLLGVRFSIVCTVFGFGLNASPADLLYLVRRPGLLLRSILAVFVLMPLAAILLLQMVRVPAAVGIVLIALSISPVPPLLPRKQIKAGGDSSYGLGLMVALSVLALAAAPMALQLAAVVFGRELGIPARAIAPFVLEMALAPLAAGMVVRAWLPQVAGSIEKPVRLAATVLLALSALLMIAATAPALLALAGNNTILAMAIFTILGLVIGHVLGRPEPDHSIVLALSTACRHPAAALTIATANCPDEPFGAIVVLYLVVSAIVGIPYLAWMRRRLAAHAGRGDVHA